MVTCRICHFATELDDVVLQGAGAGSICLRCYARETGTARPMPRALRREVSIALLATEPA